MSISGIYGIIHRGTGMCYVGSSVNIIERWRQHKRAARGSGTTRINRALRDEGVDSFDFEILEECKQPDLLTREGFYISFLRAASVIGFNTIKTPAARYDFLTSTASRARMSASQAGRTHSDDTRDRIRIAQTGRRHTVETRIKMSLSMTGKKRSDVARENIRASKIGRVLTQEHRKKIGDAHRGMKRPESTGRKISAAKLGRKTGPLTEDHRAKLAAVWIGRSHTPETKIKMSKARTRYWALARTKALEEQPPAP